MGPPIVRPWGCGPDHGGPHRRADDLKRKPFPHFENPSFINRFGQFIAKTQSEIWHQARTRLFSLSTAIENAALVLASSRCASMPARVGVLALSNLIYVGRFAAIKNIRCCRRRHGAYTVAAYSSPSESRSDSPLGAYGTGLTRIDQLPTAACWAPRRPREGMTANSGSRRALRSAQGHNATGSASRQHPSFGWPRRTQRLQFAAASLRAAESGSGGPLHVETLRVPDQLRRRVEREWTPDGKIDAAISYLVGATSGRAERPSDRPVAELSDPGHSDRRGRRPAAARRRLELGALVGLGGAQGVESALARSPPSVRFWRRNGCSPALTWTWPLSAATPGSCHSS